MGVRIKGLDHLLAKVKKLEQVLQVEVDEEMSASATTISLNATRAAPYDEGGLSGQIKENISTKFRKKVTVNKSYAPFMEFGTGKKVAIPPGLESYAAGFRKKQSGASYAKFIASLEGWLSRHPDKIRKPVGKRSTKPVNLHTQAKQMAYFISKNGLKARPFLFPAFFKEEEALVKKIQTLIKDAT